MPAASLRCPGCGSRVEAERDCPACLLRSALLEEPALDPEPPFDVDDYRVLSKIDTGGMGVVYLACSRHAEQQLVALKMIRTVLASEAALELFGREIHATVLAAHPSNVPLYHVGEYHGRLYYTMRLFDSSLARRMADFQEPRAAARLIETVARAVQYAHERGVLHRDLKPANLLLDREGRPHVADFGLARLLDASAGVEPSNPVLRYALATGSLGAGAGTPPYMAPEQAPGQITTASDIYSLGVILQELLTFPDGDTLDKASLRRRAGRELAAVCLKCTRDEPTERYRSARDLADDLARWLRHEPVSAGPPISWRRFFHLAGRQQMIAALLGLVAVLYVAIGASIQIVKGKIVRATQTANSFAAQQMAGNMLRVVGGYSAMLEDLSRDPTLIELVQGPPTREAPALQRHLEGIFDSIGVYRVDGRRNARWPTVAPGRVVDLDFGWRDYFMQSDRAGRAGRHGPYIARGILSEGDGKNKLVFSTPLYEGDRYVGVVMATIDSAATLPSLRPDDRRAGGPRGTLVGVKDRTRASPALPREYMVLVHEGLADGETADIDRALSARLLDAWGDPLGPGEQLRRESEAVLDVDYRDPVPGFEGRWLAGIAQVGRTGLAVVVRTPYAVAVRACDEMLQQMAALMLALAAGLVAAAGLIASLRRLRAARASD
jgi:hypothetical protein